MNMELLGQAMAVLIGIITGRIVYYIHYNGIMRGEPRFDIGLKIVFAICVGLMAVISMNFLLGRTL